MKAEASKSNIRGKVKAPSSKSAVQRYIACALLAEGTSTLSVVSMCDDSLAALSVAEALGAVVSRTEEMITIQGGFSPVSNEINCGESGLSARMFIPVASLHNREITITGRGSLLKRPFAMVVKPLEHLGVTVTTRNGFLPVTVRGSLKGGDVQADGSMSSQFITGLLTALPAAEKDSRVFVENLVSRPYIDLTINILKEFGIEVYNDNYRVFGIKGGDRFKAGNFTAEGDWSGAAFLLVMGALAGPVEVSGLSLQSVQADKAVIDALVMAGASVETGGGKVTVAGGRLKAFEFDITDCPDLAPPLSVLAMACNGRTVLRGTERLTVKESNRADTISNALNKIGGRIVNHGSYMEIEGGFPIKGGGAGAFNDHRIAMALATSSLISESPIIIDGFECINKSYPGFTEDFRKLGGEIRMIK